MTALKTTLAKLAIGATAGLLLGAPVAAFATSRPAQHVHVVVSTDVPTLEVTVGSTRYVCKGVTESFRFGGAPNYISTETLDEKSCPVG